MKPAPKPYPWGTITRTTRQEANTLAAVRRLAENALDLDAVATAISSLVGVSFELLLRSVEPIHAAKPLENGVGAVLVRADDPAILRGAVVEAEGPLAVDLVARAMRREVPLLTDTSRPPGPHVAGALVAILAAAARRVHKGAPMRVLAAGPSTPLASEFARVVPDVAVVTFTALVDSTAFLARVFVSRTAAMSAAPRVWDRAALRALGPMPLDVPVVAATCDATALDVASLRVGDVWMPGAWRMQKTASGWAGSALLAPARGELGVVAKLGDDGRLVLRGEVESLSWAPFARGASAMGEGDDAGALVEAMGEVPVVVRVEVGSVSMTAREWAELASGDVVALGKRIADPVVLRVGGAEIARGELVEIDGEVGVRILARADGKENRK